MKSWKETERILRETVVAIGANEATSADLKLLNELLEGDQRAACYLAEILEQEAALHDAAHCELVSSGTSIQLLNSLGSSQLPTLSQLPAINEAVDHRYEAISSELDTLRYKVTRANRAVTAFNAVLSHGLSAAVVLFCLLWLGWVSVTNSSNDTEAADEPSTQIVSMARCIWSDADSRPPSLGQLIRTGQSLSLNEGIVDFEVGNSAYQRVLYRVSGPAAVFMNQDGQLELAQGRMAVQVQGLQSSTTIPTPIGFVSVSADSSIGISADGETVSVHVFGGSADIHCHTVDDASSEIIMQLVGGEAASFDAHLKASRSQPRKHQAEPELYSFSKSLNAEPLPITDEYRQAVLDANPAIYWQLEEYPPRRLANAGYAEGMNGKLRGSASSREVAGNRLLEFGLPTVGALVGDGLWPSQPLENYTIELWMKASHYHDAAILGLVEPESDEKWRQKHGFYFGLSGPDNSFYNNSRLVLANSYRVVHRSPPALKEGTECNPSSQYKIREWQHLVFRKSAGVLDVFINGEIVDTAEDETPLPPNLLLVIGQLYESADGRAFTGQLDEVALYEHALDDEVVKHHHQLGRTKTIDPKAI